MLKDYNKILKTIIVLLLPLFAFSQQEPNTSSYSKDKQRALLIYNFAQQIEWDNTNELNSFRIGVIGENPVISDLKKIAKEQSIHGKRVVIKKVSSISSIKNISLLFVDRKYDYKISSLLNLVSKKNILIVSENYKFHESMINIANIGDNFQYELNMLNILKEGFIIKPSLLKNAINSESKWHESQIESDKYLVLEKKEVIIQNKILKQKEDILKKQFEKIEAQKDLITEQFEDIYYKKNRLEKLDSIKKDQNLRFEQKIASLDSLETFITQQEKKIGFQENAISNQENFLKKQLKQIDIQKKILSRQENELSIRKKQNLIAFALFGLTILVGFFILRSNQLKKSLNNELILKNIAIEQRTEALEAQNAEMEQFAYIASHDLKEPLNTISSFIQLIDEDYKHLMDDIGQQSITYIKDASIRMKDLIPSLLEYSKLGKLRNLESVDCTSVYNNLQKDLYQLINSSNTKLITSDLPKIYANKVEIRLLFQNLITNAIKFIPKGKTPVIKINCEKQTAVLNNEEYWKFSISDNGIGIKEQHLQKIFAIFQRLHSTEEYEGTGIGLAHCKKIVKSLKGEIGVISEFGKGSTFWFTIPCQKVI